MALAPRRNIDAFMVIGEQAQDGWGELEIESVYKLERY
jgi:hypothetical protein